MSTKDCGHSKPCGCEDQPLTGLPPCEQGTPNCPEPDPCPETFRAECLVWTSDDLICDTTVLATEGDRLPIILERIVALFCNQSGAGLAGVALTVPDADGLIIGLQDRIINVDRNNCHDIIRFTPVGAPAGILFDYTDETGALITGSTEVVLAPTQSSVRFDIDITGAGGLAGVYTFTLDATVCGNTMSAQVQINV